jgi:transposase
MRRRYGGAVRRCDKAGRDGFWLHRDLVAHGGATVVVDASSLAVDRRQRRVKTDRVDVSALVNQLMNTASGDTRGWRESARLEADRHLQREWEKVREDRKRIRNRIQGLLVTQGCSCR